MSPRAAWRLERLGFEVYDYAAGKVDWLAAGMPTIRSAPSEPRALDAADDDPPTCSPDAVVGQLNGSVLVLNDERVVLGRISRPEAHPASATAGEVLDPGPTTVRAHEPLEPLLARMKARNVAEIIVTTPEGRLLGVVRREAGDRAGR